MKMQLEGKAGGIVIPTLLGAPLVLIPLSAGGDGGVMRYALIDEADYPLVKDFKWFAYWNPTARGFYARTTTPRNPTKTTFSLHRHVLGLAAHDPRKVDHKSGAGLDNRRSNLRISSQAQNGFNRGRQRNNASGFKGVCRSQGRWRAEIKAGKRRHLGYFDTPEEAARAYDRAAKELHGVFAKVNGA